MNLPLSQPVAVFAVLAMVTLAVPALARRIRMPEIVALILAGAAVGAPGLGLLGEASGLRLLSDVGLLYLMFLAGLEIDLAHLRRHNRPTLALGTTVFLLPFLAGTLAARFLLGFAWLPALLFGGLLSPYTLVPYPTVRRLGLVRDPAVAAAVGGNFVADTFALLTLAAVIGAQAGQNAGTLGLRLLGGTLLLGLIGFGVVPRMGRWFFRHRGDHDLTGFLFLFANLLGLAWLAEAAGLSPILGAFVAGIALNPLVPAESRLMNRVAFTGSVFFIPAFLLSVGMLLDLRGFVLQPAGWETALLMLGIVFGANLLNAALARRLFGFDRDEGWMVFGLCVNKAAAALAIALMGYRAGLFDQGVLNSAIVLILATCTVGPWVTEWAGRRLAARQKAHAATGTPRQQRLLVPVANPITASDLLDLALMFRDRRHHQPVIPLAVALEDADPREALTAAERLLAHTLAHTAATDVPMQPETRLAPSVADGILRAATELRATTLILGWTSRAAVSRLIFSTVLDQLLPRSSQQLLVCRLEQPVHTSRRLVLLLPPMTARLSGFAETLHTLGLLLRHSGRPLLLLGEAEELAAARTSLSRNAAALPAIAEQPLAGWSSFWPALEAALRADDWVVMVGCRVSSLAWQPGLDRLPQRFVHHFPKHSLIVAYPAESVPDTYQAGETAATGTLTAMLGAPATSFPGLPPGPGDQAISTLLTTWFQSRDQAISAGAVAGLTDLLLRAAVEVQPGAVLLHVHTQHVAEPVVLIGTSPAGLRLPNLAGPVHVLLVLVSPDTCPPEEHLRNLSEIARLALGHPELGRLAQAATADDIRALLNPPPANSTT
jgi:Kef-type K+ transport system membrane component KefB